MSLEQKLKKTIAEATAVLELLKVYPDLREEKDEYGHVRLVSRKVNRNAVDVEFRKACDCCKDADVFAYPYLTVKDYKIYTEPMRVVIGKLHEDGMMSSWDWEDEMYRQKIGGGVIVHVMEYIAKNRPSSAQDEDNEEGDYLDMIDGEV